LHCGFIAHYDINGFYNTYFTGDKDDLLQFCRNFLDEVYTEKPYSCQTDMNDINVAMSLELEKEFPRLIKPFVDKTRQTALFEIKRLMAYNNINVNDLRVSQ